ncbi:MAG: hypothetical protein GY834_06050 [Bacteroidetes bacterium]|nr:hypothetical protein [Bacteroidota bacterium]
MRTSNIFLFLLISLLISSCDSGIKNLNVENYISAEQFIPKNAAKLVFNNNVRANWIDETDNFWYTVNTRKGKEFLLVNTVVKTKEAAFDHIVLAERISNLLDTIYNPYKLPFNRISFNEDKRIEFTLKEKFYCFDNETFKLIEIGRETHTKGEKSPDGKWTAYVKNSFNLKIC